MENQIAIYRSDDGRVSLSVQFNQETVWLTQKQMAELFDKTLPNINMHIKNVYREGELNPTSTIKKSLIVQDEGGRMVSREVDFYNLDVIISVGYRVKSKRGTQFRQWATQVLRQHLVQGYTVHQKRLDELQQTIRLVTRESESGDLNLNEARGLLDVLREFSRSLELLVRYDDQSLDETVASQPEIHSLSEAEALDVIAMLKEDLLLKKQAGLLFGNRKDEQFGGILQTINQTFDGDELYPTVEEKAAHLLYFIIKNHRNGGPAL